VKAIIERSGEKIGPFSYPTELCFAALAAYQADVSAVAKGNLVSAYARSSQQKGLVSLTRRKARHSEAEQDRKDRLEHVTIPPYSDRAPL
jgi:hypothetical protein